MVLLSRLECELYELLRCPVLRQREDCIMAAVRVYTASRLVSRRMRSYTSSKSLRALVAQEIDMLVCFQTNTTGCTEDQKKELDPPRFLDHDQTRSRNVELHEDV